jgi:hypothetical protein
MLELYDLLSKTAHLRTTDALREMALPREVSSLSKHTMLLGTGARCVT